MYVILPYTELGKATSAATIHRRFFQSKNHLATPRDVKMRVVGGGEFEPLLLLLKYFDGEAGKVLALLKIQLKRKAFVRHETSEVHNKSDSLSRRK